MVSNHINLYKNVLKFIDKGVIILAEFCTCGSLKINSQCTNKNCSLGEVIKSPTAKGSRAKTTRAKKSDEQKASKDSSARKASKCVTYSLSDLEEKENAE